MGSPFQSISRIPLSQASSTAALSMSMLMSVSALAGIVPFFAVASGPFAASALSADGIHSTRCCVCCWLPNGKRGRVIMPVVAAGPAQSSEYSVAIIAYVARARCRYHYHR